jgi:LysR family glycine cleavage system transcriptional activator
MKSQRFPDLPPPASLVVFEAAAFHESFSKAAEELCLSASAVAHQVKKLEASMNTQLFDRHARGVRLNNRGQEYFSQVRLQLGQLQHYSAQLKASSEQPIRIKTQHAVAQFWLQPRLRDYQNQFDDPEFEITATSNIESLPLNSDIAIGFFAEPPEDPAWKFLWAEQLLPVKGPGYESKDLVLYQDSHWKDDWNVWQSLSQQSALIQVSKTRRTSLYALVLQSVLDNQGFMLARTSLLRNYIDHRQLLPLSNARPVEYGGYYLFRSPYRNTNPFIEQFYLWLLEVIDKQGYTGTGK